MAGSGGGDRTVDGRAARWAGQRTRRRAEIVAAGLAAIHEHGPGVSTEQIAAGAGVARPGIYRHFADAEELYDALARGAAHLLVEALAPALTQPAGTAFGMITHAVRTFVVWLAEHTALYRFVVLRSVGVHAPGEPLIADVRTAIAGMLRDLFVAYLTIFDADTSLSDPMAFAVVGMVESATARWLTEPGALTRDELVARLSEWVWALLDNLLRGVGVILDPGLPLPDLPA